MDYNTIIKYLQGLASADEKQQFFVWLEEDPANKKEFAELKKIWALTEKGKEDENSAYLQFRQNENRKNRRTGLFKVFKQAAAVIVLIGLGAVAAQLLKNTEKEQEIYAASYSVKAPLGQMTNLELPDGTMVVLNSGSTISYKSNFSYGNREVTLAGEAFFDVQQDKDYPFVVKAPLLDIKVYGTSFNIEAYPNEESFSATLVEGSVSVMNKRGDELTLLKPGENASLLQTADKQLVIKKVNTEIYTSWKEGLITFRNEKLEDIARKLERWYNVEIVIRDERLKQECYFGTILKNKPIDQILEVFKLTTSLEYEIIPRANQPTLIYWN